MDVGKREDRLLDQLSEKLGIIKILEADNAALEQRIGELERLLHAYRAD
jgi:hypothetical protein